MRDISAAAANDRVRKVMQITKTSQRPADQANLKSPNRNDCLEDEHGSNQSCTRPGRDSLPSRRRHRRRVRGAAAEVPERAAARGVRRATRGVPLREDRGAHRRAQPHEEEAPGDVPRHDRADGPQAQERAVQDARLQRLRPQRGRPGRDHGRDGVTVNEKSVNGGAIYPIASPPLAQRRKQSPPLHGSLLHSVGTFLSL